MHPELFSLPGGFTIKTYGFCLMVGFLTGVWLAMRRAQRVNADPDTVLDISFLCLLFGVGGARAFYVIHYWQTQFADAPNKFIAVIDITNGGLEFLGGFLGAVVATCVFAVWKKIPLRLYLDIAAPSAMWGLALGRIGCFFNGCCFGGLCVEPETQKPAYAWAVQFPFSSPPHWRHWEERRVSVPAELIHTSKEALQPWLVPMTQIESPVEKRETARRAFLDAKDAYDKAKAGSANNPGIEKLKQAYESAAKKAEAVEKEFLSLRLAQKHPSRKDPSRMTSVSELEALAHRCRSLPIHPTQLYAAAGAMILSLFLSTVFYRRRRHGVVIGLLLLLYPIQRTLEEMIRSDNPSDVFGLTASQFTGLALFVLGAAYLFVLYTRFPERSPAALASIPTTRS